MSELPVSPAGYRYGALPPSLIVNPATYKRPYLLRHDDEAFPASNYDNVTKFPRKIKNQSTEGSCTGHGWSVHQEFLEISQNNKDVELSPTGIYYLERKSEGTLGQGDCGAQVITGAQVVTRWGVAPLADEPYVAGDFETAPTAEQMLEATQNKSTAYHPLLTINDLKACILSGYTFVLGMSVYSSFEDIGSNGLMPMPDVNTESLLGGHCMSSGWAFDDTIECPNSPPGAILTQNSWGASFGLNGRLWIPYQYFQSTQQFVSDLWVSHLGAQWGKPALPKVA